MIFDNTFRTSDSQKSQVARNARAHVYFIDS